MKSSIKTTFLERRENERFLRAIFTIPCPGITHHLIALAAFSRKRQKANILSISTNWEIDSGLLCFQTAYKSERLNVLAFLYSCLNIFEATLVFVLVHLPQSSIFQWL